MQKPQDRYVKVGPINTRYWTEGEEGQRSPVILLHGLGGFIETWQLIFDALAEHHRVYAVDLPGHGRTDKPLGGPYRIAELACFVRDFMKALGLSRAHLVGHSLGGATAARLTILFPEVVDRLVLVSSAGLGRELTIALRLATIPALGEIFTRPNRDAVVRGVKAMPGIPADKVDEAIDVWCEMTSQPGAQRGILRVLRANANLLGQHPSQYAPIVAGLGSITRPVLVIWGQQDTVVPVAHAQVAARGMPDARVEILDPCNHIPILEQPDICRKLLAEFLGD